MAKKKNVIPQQHNNNNNGDRKWWKGFWKRRHFSLSITMPRNRTKSILISCCFLLLLFLSFSPSRVCVVTQSNDLHKRETMLDGDSVVAQAVPKFFIQ
jgi:hypothetical protein